MGVGQNHRRGTSEPLEHPTLGEDRMESGGRSLATDHREPKIILRRRAVDSACAYRPVSPAAARECVPTFAEPRRTPLAHASRRPRPAREKIEQRPPRHLHAAPILCRRGDELVYCSRKRWTSPGGAAFRATGRSGVTGPGRSFCALPGRPVDKPADGMEFQAPGTSYSHETGVPSIGWKKFWARGLARI